MGQVTRVIPIPASTGVPTVIRCTRVTSRMQIVEDGAANAGVQQGLTYQQLTPNSTTAPQTAANPNEWTVGPAIQVPPGQEPIVFAGYPGDHPPNTVPIGKGGSSPFPVCPGGPVTLGTPICQITSATATATTIDVTEWF